MAPDLNAGLLDTKQIGFRLVGTKPLQRPCGYLVEV
jgi:hypothetical protein